MPILQKRLIVSHLDFLSSFFITCSYIEQWRHIWYFHSCWLFHKVLDSWRNQERRRGTRTLWGNVKAWKYLRNYFCKRGERKSAHFIQHTCNTPNYTPQLPLLYVKLNLLPDITSTWMKKWTGVPVWCPSLSWLRSGGEHFADWVCCLLSSVKQQRWNITGRTCVASWAIFCCWQVLSLLSISTQVCSQHTHTCSHTHTHVWLPEAHLKTDVPQPRCRRCSRLITAECCTDQAYLTFWLTDALINLPYFFFFAARWWGLTSVCYGAFLTWCRAIYRCHLIEVVLTRMHIS